MALLSTLFARHWYIQCAIIV